jgi:hypothetical protein
MRGKRDDARKFMIKNGVTAKTGGKREESCRTVPWEFLIVV